jgi:hypothetical protein
MHDELTLGSQVKPEPPASNHGQGEAGVDPSWLRYPILPSSHPSSARSFRWRRR